MYICWYMKSSLLNLLRYPLNKSMAKIRDLFGKVLYDFSINNIFYDPKNYMGELEPNMFFYGRRS